MTSVSSMRVILVATVLAIYGQMIRHGFVDYDDPLVVTDNEMVKAGIGARGIAWAWTTGEFANWMPLTWMSHQLDWQLFGDWAGGHHFTSLLLHVASTLLLFEALRIMTMQAPPSFAVAILWAAHPLHVESVAWIAERKGVLANAFGMLTLWLHARHVRQPTRDSMGFVLVAYIGCLLSKQTWVTLPALLALLWIWPLGKERQERGEGWRETAPLWAAAGIFAAVAYFAQRGGGAVASLGDLPLGFRVENALVSAVVYLRKFFWPADLMAFYPHPLGTLSTAVVAACASVLVLVSIMTLWWRTLAAYLTVGWYWYIIALLPVSGLIPVGRHGMADRYMDLAMVGLLMGLAWLAWERIQSRAVFWTLLASVAFPMGAASVVQVGHWRSTRALFEHALAVHIDNPMAHMQLAVVEAHAGDLAAALEHAKAAVNIDPSFAMARANLGVIQRDLGFVDQAVESFLAAGDLGERRFYAEAARGLLAWNRPAEAYAVAGRALGDGAEDDDAIIVASSAALMSGRLEEGIARLQKLVGAKPELAEAHRLLGVALWQKGDGAGARDHIVRACSLDPGQRASIEGLATLDKPDARMVAIHAACLEATGEKERGAEERRRAVTLARASGEEDLAREIERGSP